MQINIFKSQKTSGDLGNIDVNDWENRKKIGVSILHLIFYYLQKLDWGFIKLKNQIQYNESSFCSPAEPQNMKNQYWSSEN